MFTYLEREVTCVSQIAARHLIELIPVGMLLARGFFGFGGVATVWCGISWRRDDARCVPFAAAEAEDAKSCNNQRSIREKGSKFWVERFRTFMITNDVS